LESHPKRTEDYCKGSDQEKDRGGFEIVSNEQQQLERHCKRRLETRGIGGGPSRRLWEKKGLGY